MDCIAGTVVSATSDHEDDNHQTTFPNLFFISLVENPQVINLVNSETGHSHVKAWLPNIVKPVIHALDQNHNLSLVKNLYNQNIPQAKHHSTHKVFHVSFCHKVIFVQLPNNLSSIQESHHL